MRTGISRVVPGNFSQAGCNANNEFTDRIDYGFIVAVFVVFEPDPVVVVSKVFEKIEKVCGKTVEFRHGGPSETLRPVTRGCYGRPGSCLVYTGRSAVVNAFSQKVVLKRER